MNMEEERSTVIGVRSTPDTAEVRPRMFEKTIASPCSILWLAFWFIAAFIGIFRIGIESIPLGLLFYVFAVTVGLLPLLAVSHGGFRGLKDAVIAYCKDPTWPFPEGFFLSILGCILIALKYIFIVLFYLVIGLIFLSGKPSDRRMYERFFLYAILWNSSDRR